ncbi:MULTISPECIES: YciI family protein [unclassified Crossiella]|uniref:YciI family protein n=1 Tax=unclassified Crossiella TaxID=2620835 RepID=UPI001FFFFFD0|nr:MULTISPECIES: YciI family protein [unclassified Crossiella]MCK2239643.1 YciI family protein [Crossiella sp. S99.2]MCK2252338.1 YciI family protein [Crossiella sp. S99.1]
MQYLLLICQDESRAEENTEGCGTWGQDLAERGITKGGGILQPSTDATTLRLGAQGEVLLSDGPFAETKEQIAGFVLIECADLDEAVEIAKGHPGAIAGGSVEIRPLWTGGMHQG